MDKLRKRTKAIALLIAMGLFLSPPMVAQNDGFQGLFGRGDNNGGSNRSEVGVSGMLNQGFGATSGNLINQGFGFTQGDLDNQGFGGTNGGITNESFDMPLNSGLLIMLATGAGYATLKKRNQTVKKNQK